MQIDDEPLTTISKARSYGREVIHFIRRHWKPMLATGTTWENFAGSDPDNSYCHAWTAHPCIHFANILGGIRPIAPAWGKISFSPVFADDIDHLDISLPSPMGMIRVHWSRTQDKIVGTLSLPSGTTAKVQLPGQRSFVTQSTQTFAVAAKVEIPTLRDSLPVELRH